MVDGIEAGLAQVNSSGQGRPSSPDLVGIAQATGSDGERAVAVNYEPALRTDVWIYRIVVATFGLVLVAATVGGVVIGLRGGEVPEVVIALGTGSVGALGGLLAPSPSARR
jgi:hypothetical protein